MVIPGKCHTFKALNLLKKSLCFFYVGYQFIDEAVSFLHLSSNIFYFAVLILFSLFTCIVKSYFDINIFVISFIFAWNFFYWLRRLSKENNSIGTIIGFSRICSTREFWWYFLGYLSSYLSQDISILLYFRSICCFSKKVFWKIVQYS